MEIIEVNKLTFGEIIPAPYHVFSSSEFAGLNRSKAETIHYLLFKDGKYRLGLIGGVHEDIFYSPFSAPFGGFVYLKKDVKISIIDRAIESLTDWAPKNNIKEISLCLPPAIYQQSFIAKQINSLYRTRFLIRKIDLSYSFSLDDFDEYYTHRIWRNARKNISIALEQDLKFRKCESEQEHILAYKIIRENRQLKGFPLRMSWQQVRKTIHLIKADFFMVFAAMNKPIASAIIFHVSDKIVQVIYWGDIADSSTNKAMNFLAFKLFEYYKGLDFKVIDLGPSTENSIPNPGLCEFKESLGCEIQPKFTFSKQL